MLEDAPGIAKVLVEGWKATYARILQKSFLDSFNYATHESFTPQHLQALPASCAVLVAIEAAEVVGVASLKDADPPLTGSTAELDALYVLPSRQHEGIGTRLLLASARWLTRRRRDSLVLWVLRDNPYRRFYSKYGGRAGR
jgi:GNAT superfamily N-acetyltransferase